MKKFNIVKIALLSAVSLSAATSRAQMDSCNVFLQGKYLEVGINSTGTLGSSVSEPAGYHGNVMAQGPDQFPCNYDMFTTRLGIVSDPAMDDWTSYDGDFLTPGYGIYGFNSPYESYILAVGDSAVCYNTSIAGVTNNPFPGSNTTYSNSGGTVSSTYTNLFDSVLITQVTHFDTSSLYISMDVTFTNTASIPKDRIIYIRTMAPMNDEVLTGDYNVKTSVVYNRPTDPYSLVSAVGTIDTTSYIALGTTDTNSKCFMYPTWPLPILFEPTDTEPHTPTDLYNGAYAYPTYYSGTDSNYYAIGLAFSIPHLAPADSASDSVYRVTSAGMRPANSQTVHLFYSTSRAATTSALGAATTGIVNVTHQDIRVYPNPAVNEITTEGLLKTDQVNFTDYMGRRMNGSWPLSNDGTNILSVAGLPIGYYVMVISDVAGNVKAKVPLQKN